MRISGYGSGFEDFGGDRDRAAAFRSRHSIGQRVRGRILRREPNGLFRVLVGGEELLARLEVAADPGDELIFVVRELVPEIILQALAPGCAAADLSGLLQRFRAAREVFEQQDAEILAAASGLAPDPERRRAAFLTAVAAHPEAQDRLRKVLDLVEQINSAAPPALGMRAIYAPWLSPGLRRSEAWLRGDSAALSAEAAACGGVEARYSRSAAPPDLLRFLSADPASAGALAAEAAELIRSRTGRTPRVVSARLARPTPRGGVLGEMLGEATPWSSGGLNTRV